MNGTNANTVDHQEGYPLVLRLTLSNISGLLCVISNILNLFVLKMAPNCFGETTTCLVRVLAVADLSNGLFFLSFENLSLLTFDKQILRNYWFCFVFQVGRMITIFSSLHLITFVTVDRFVAIRYPLKYATILSPAKVYVVLAAILLYDVFTSLLISSRAFRFDGLAYDERTRFCAFTRDYRENVVYSILLAIVSYVIGVFGPALFIVSANFYLLVVTVRQLKEMSKVLPVSTAVNKLDTDPQRLNLPGNTSANAVDGNTARLDTFRRELRVFFIFLVITGIFLISYLPTWLVILFRRFWPSARYLSLVSYQMLTFNSWANSIIYLTMLKTFRNALKKVVKNLFKK